ncbi:MAG TPA: hypothetical protein VIO94_14020 [Phenylobacterium sp.]
MTHASSPPRRRRTGPAIWSAAVAFALAAGSSLASAWPALVRRAAGGRLHVPSADLFTSQPIALQLHILALGLAVPLGLVMMASRKGRAFHRVAGWT